MLEPELPIPINTGQHTIVKRCLSHAKARGVPDRHE